MRCLWIRKVGEQEGLGSFRRMEGTKREDGERYVTGGVGVGRGIGIVMFSLMIVVNRCMLVPNSLDTFKSDLIDFVLSEMIYNFCVWYTLSSCFLFFLPQNARELRIHITSVSDMTIHFRSCCCCYCHTCPSCSCSCPGSSSHTLTPSLLILSSLGTTAKSTR